MKNNVVGIDLAKSSFHIHEATRAGQKVKSKKMSRPELLKYLKKIDPTTIYMEACGTSHYWGRKAASSGHTVKMIAPQYVKPYVKRQKTDAADAEAIVEAGTRKHMQHVPVKSLVQQDIQSILRIRDRIVGNRTQLINQIHGLLGEYGVAVGKGHQALRKALIKILAGEGCQEPVDHDLTAIMYRELQLLQSELIEADRKIDDYEEKIKQIAAEDERCKRAMTVPGVGPVTAAAVVAAIGDARDFKNSRQLAAWVGLTPRQHSTGGKTRILGISKAGNKELRTLLIHGGRAVMMNPGKKKDRRSQWAVELKDRVGMNKAAVAMAHKNIRTLYALLKYDTEYNDKHKPRLTKQKCA